MSSSSLSTDIRILLFNTGFLAGAGEPAGEEEPVGEEDAPAFPPPPPPPAAFAAVGTVTRGEEDEGERTGVPIALAGLPSSSRSPPPRAKSQCDPNEEPPWIIACSLEMSFKRPCGGDTHTHTGYVHTHKSPSWPPTDTRAHQAQTNTDTHRHRHKDNQHRRTDTDTGTQTHTDTGTLHTLTQAHSHTRAHKGTHRQPTHTAQA